VYEINHRVVPARARVLYDVRALCSTRVAAGIRKFARRTFGNRLKETRAGGTKTNVFQRREGGTKADITPSRIVFITFSSPPPCACKRTDDVQRNFQLPFDFIRAIPFTYLL